MKHSNKGFSLYLTFLVTTAIFILVLGSYEIGKISLDIGKSSSIDTILFHAADGGLERGLARLRQKFSDFRLSYSSILTENHRLEIIVEAEEDRNLINLTATATLYIGQKKISSRCLHRKAVENKPGRLGIGYFMEAS